MKNKLSKLLIAAAILPAANSFAGVFVITDDAQPAGKGDLEAHLNWGSTIATDHGRNVGSEAGLEFAYGATETLEVGFSFDFAYDYVSSRYARKTGGESASDFNFTGISIGLKNQILDPEKDENPFGLAMVGGFAYGFAAANQDAARDIAFNLGLNFQKNLAGGDLILAFTPGVEFATSWNREDDAWEDGIVYSLAAGASYQVAEGFRVGVEAAYEIEYSDTYEGAQFHAGPNVCYEAESWWVTACVAPRLFTTADDVAVSVQVGVAF